MSELQGWTRETAARWLAKTYEVVPPTGEAATTDRNAFLKQNSVLVRFRVGDSVKTAIRSDLARLPALPNETAWFTLTSPARTEGLRMFGSREEMVQTRRELTVEDPLPLQVVFDQFLQRNYEAIESNDPVVLDAAHRVAQWLMPVLSGLPSLNFLRKKLAVRRLLEPMENVTRSFMGREEYLITLRGFVDVLDSESRLESASRFISSFRGTAALMLHGIGGSGKTTLLNEFIRQHLTGDTPFPFAYLDFDDPSLNVASLDTLFDEIATQLEAQYSEIGVDDARLRARKLASVDFQVAQDSTKDSHTLAADTYARSHAIRQRNAEEVAEMLAFLLERIRQAEPILRSVEIEDQRPFLLVLDTFEEVQKRGIERATYLWHFLRTLKQHFPDLRVVVAGRAPVREIEQFGSAEEIELGEFDERLAITYLNSIGVADFVLGRTLYKQVGGNPLSLKLAAQVAKLYGVGSRGIRDLKTKSFLLFAANEQVIQGQLYQRILARIPHEAIQRLAHPGLAVRRITPAIIQLVLAVPCGLGQIELATAERLFEELKLLVDLVTVEPDGALRHRQDLRRVMLKLLAAEQPIKTREIHRKAFEYFAERQDAASQIEAAYHALQVELPQDEFASSLTSTIAELLLSAVEEFPVSSQLLLYRVTKQEPPDEIRREADLAQWESFVERKARRALQYGEVDTAMRLVDERPERSPGSGLYAISALGELSRGNIDKAVQAIEGGIQSAMAANRRDRMVELSRLRGELLYRIGRGNDGEAELGQATLLALQIGQPSLAIQIIASRVRFWLKVPAADLFSEVLAQLTIAVQTCSDEDFQEARLQFNGLFKICGPLCDPLLKKGLRMIRLSEWPSPSLVRGTIPGSMHPQDTPNDVWDQVLEVFPEDQDLRKALAELFERAITPDTLEASSA